MTRRYLRWRWIGCGYRDRRRDAGGAVHCGVHDTVVRSMAVPPLSDAVLVTQVNGAAVGAVAPVQRSKLIVGVSCAWPGLITKVSCTALLKSFKVGRPLTPVRRAGVPPVGTLPVPGNATTPDGYSIQKLPPPISRPVGATMWICCAKRVVVDVHATGAVTFLQFFGQLSQ